MSLMDGVRPCGTWIQFMIACAVAHCQAVILLVDHGSSGSVGLVLNRPTGLVLGRKSGGLPFTIDGAPQRMQELFADNRCVTGPVTHVGQPQGRRRLPAACSGQAGPGMALVGDQHRHACTPRSARLC